MVALERERAIERVVARITVAIDLRLREAMSKWPEGDAVLVAWEKALDGVAAPDARITALAQWVAGKRAIPGAGAAASLPDVTRGALERLGPELAEVLDRFLVFGQPTSSIVQSTPVLPRGLPLPELPGLKAKE